MNKHKADVSEPKSISAKSLLTLFELIEQLNLAVNSFILLQNGISKVQFYRKPYRQDSLQHLFSLSKSFTSIAIGIARDEGLLALSDTVISFFPDKLPAILSENLTQMTIHHLLAMNAGHHENIYGEVAEKTDWVKAYLSLEVQHKPGTYYRYSTHSTYMLAAILEKAAGVSLIDYLMPRLFEPLGISEVNWETCLLGIAAGGMGLSISTEGIAKFGQMLLNKGMFDGRSIVSEDYINLATKAQSDSSRDEDRIDFAQGYGYQFFMCREGCYMGNGGYGQMCFVAPHMNLVIAVTASFANMKQLQILLELIYEHLLKKSNIDLSVEHEDSGTLNKYLSGLTYAFPATAMDLNNTDVLKLSNRRYTMQDNPQHITQISFSAKGEHFEFHMKFEDNGVKIYKFEFDRFSSSSDLFVKDLALHHQEVVTQAAWKNTNTLLLTMRYIETPYRLEYFITFDREKIELKCTSNKFADYELVGLV